MLTITVVLEPCEDGGFTASVPTIPGCISEGETIEETLTNIREAIEMILEATDDDRVVGEGSLLYELGWEYQNSKALPASPEGGGSGSAAPEPESLEHRPRRRVIRAEIDPKGPG
jgi:predicted RNase H-like HicB family nuclease